MVKRRDEALSGTCRLGPRRPISALGFAAGAVALWSSNALAGKTLLANHPVSQVQFLQFAGAALVFAVIRSVSRDRAPPPVGLSAMLVATAVGFVGLVGTMVLQYAAFASVPVIEANLVAYTWPLMVAAAAIVLENPRRPALLGLAAGLGLVGVGLVISGGRAHFWLQGHPFGYLAAFGSALCMAFYSVAVGRVATSPERLLLPSSLIGVALTFLWCAWEAVPWPTGADFALGLYLGAGPMGLGYYFWAHALKLGGSGRVAVIAYLTPIASTVLLTLSGERLTMTAIAGAVLVIGSCIAVGMERSEAGNHG
ncbi:DMT family transporter [Mesorhizobium sp. ES1-1]|uniref:DMT family transporter n=1 Tax=Mesorhizobium sp. ES1-1 TaxID=2876629 RepID=UPI001CCEC0C0|nr:DMT family transporter [Mesorhizobium sp. ES1-1]MBZ9674958.1 DMT family transporter [Mesorhizobium sp. ES1-1]